MPIDQADPGEPESFRDAEGLDELPLDSDVEVDDISASAPPRPVHLRWSYIGLVALGGVLGTGAREGLSLLLPPPVAFPWIILVINVTGAFVLGLLLELLRRLGSDAGRRRALRLFVGTGVLGGYTTYSTLAVGTATAIVHGHAGTGILYALVSVVAGAAAAFAGIAAGAVWHRGLASKAVSAEAGAR